MVPGSAPASIVTVSSVTLSMRPASRANSSVGVPSRASSGTSGRTRARVRVPCIGSMSFASGCTRTTFPAPACTCT